MITKEDIIECGWTHYYDEDKFDCKVFFLKNPENCLMANISKDTIYLSLEEGKRVRIHNLQDFEDHDSCFLGYVNDKETLLTVMRLTGII